MTDVVVGDPRGDSDLEQFASVDAEAFGMSREHSLTWLAAGRERLTVRVARDGDAVVGGYALMATGQFFGGRSVPARCVAAVAVHPMARRRGVPWYTVYRGPQTILFGHWPAKEPRGAAPAPESLPFQRGGARHAQRRTPPGWPCTCGRSTACDARRTVL